MEVRVCPACNSTDVSSDSLFKFEQRCGLSREICGNCGYSGPMTVMERKGDTITKISEYSPKSDTPKLKVLRKKRG